MVDRDVTLETLLAQRHAELGLYLVTLTPKPERAGRERETAEGRELLRQHLLYWWRLEEEGKLIGAGPVARNTPQVHGMAILAAASREEAERLAEAEPFHRAGWRVNTVSEWQLNEGLMVELVRKQLRGDD